MAILRIIWTDSPEFSMVLPHELYRLDGLFGVLDCTTLTNFYELYHLDGLFGVLDGTTLQTLQAVSSR